LQKKQSKLSHEKNYEMHVCTAAALCIANILGVMALENIYIV
jgi:hypothetical protein